MSNELAQTVEQNRVVELNRAHAGSLLMDAASMNSMIRVAELMTNGKATVPAHLQKNQSDCLAVVMQAMQWGMNPFAVAQKTHLVNGTLGYEAQLVNAVVQASGSIDGRFHFEFRGESPAVECRVGAVLKGEQEITWGQWHCENKVTTKNSPLWKTNPRQQMAYLQTKMWARLYCPGAILGVYTPDELEVMPRTTKHMGDADVVGDPIDVQPYVAGALATTTLEEAAKYWAEHNGKFVKQPQDHGLFKKAYATHYKSLKDKPAQAAQAEEKEAASMGMDEVLGRMLSAKTLDELYVSADLARLVLDAAEQKELETKFDEIKARLEAA